MKKYFSGLLGSGKAYFLLEKLKENKTILAVVPDDKVSVWYDNLLALSQFFEDAAVYRFVDEYKSEGITTLFNLCENKNAIIVTDKESLKSKVRPLEEFKKSLIKFNTGDNYHYEGLTKKIVELGYDRFDFVEEKGQFARRGEILDIWSPDQDLPWRLVFNGNNLESMRQFSIATQRSEEFVVKGFLLPAKEKGEKDIKDYLPKDAVVYLDNPEIELSEDFNSYKHFVNDSLNNGAENTDFKTLKGWFANYKLFLGDLEKFSKQEYCNIVICSHYSEKDRLEEILSDNRFSQKLPEFFIGPLAESFYSPSRKLAVFSSQEILYKKRPVHFPKMKTGRRMEGLWEISPNDYVVHEKYGVGRYLGLKKIARGEHQSEYLYIEYRGGDKLYVPIDDFKIVQKYVGIEGYRPKLCSLDTALWERIKKRAKQGAEKLASELLKLYAARQHMPGCSYPGDTVWEKELKDTFPYTETEDQVRTIEEVKHDLQLPRPMERLVCGDVGFGKTEVAVRAAFKVAVNSKQVAVLVPTTVLAEQHFNTFSNRLAAFPMNVAMLSRFQSKKEQKKIVKDLEAGLVDIIIGTHRLIQKDIQFKDLGLMIVDEEHRFGVKQKEKIKKFKKNIDVLLLSATPIPRTLSFALSNLRDLSVIETPPYGRLPIETHLGPFDEKTVKTIINAELSRGGQVYYVHNRVETILSRAAYLKRLIPEIRWGIVHGQLPAAQIEKVMWQFLHKEIDVLIATSIIESGLDIPSVNTMIVEEAENFGLSQLYQLRGRIGREKQKAYCYLFYTPSLIKEDGRKRLEALMEFNELGSGFRLALRDLEIRGAGNILGAEQHGFVKEVGFELYSRLIKEAGKSLKTDKVETTEKAEFKPVLEFEIPAYLPDDYISTEELRILFYRKFISAKDNKGLEEVVGELTDRFGKLPQPSQNLLTISKLRIICEKLKIKSIIEDGKFISIFFTEKISFTPDKILLLAESYKGIIEFIRGAVPGVKFNKTAIKGNVFIFLDEFLSKLKEFVIIH